MKSSRYSLDIKNKYPHAFGQRLEVMCLPLWIWAAWKEVYGSVKLVEWQFDFEDADSLNWTEMSSCQTIRLRPVLRWPSSYTQLVSLDKLNWDQWCKAFEWKLST